MKHKKYTILILLVSILFFSCKKGKNNDNIKKFTVISFDISSPEIINLEDFILKAEIIPLETNDSSMLSSLINIHSCEDTIFIYDTKQVSMFSFTSKGKYIGKSKHLFGPGPKELNYIQDVAINPFTNEIDFLSPFGTILISDKDFKYKNKIKYHRNNKIINQFQAITEDTYILSTGMSEEYLVYSKSKDKIINKIKVSNPFVAGGINGGEMPFNYYDGTLYYTPNYFHNTVYKVNNENITPAWKIDFGKHKNIPEDDKSTRYPEYIMNHPEKVYPYFKKETKNGFITIVLNEKKKIIAIYSKKSNNTKVFNATFKDGSIIKNINYANNEHIYNLISPKRLRSIFNINSPLITKYKKIIDSIPEEDNYVLIKYTINQKIWDK